MAYMVARLFSGSSDQTPEQLDRLAHQELVPQLLQIPGLIRYSTLRFHDGRVGSFSVYENREAANRGLRVASEWVSHSEAVRDYRLDETLRGEVVYTLVGQGDQLQRNAHGIARIYQTNASIDEVRIAIEQEASDALQHIPGLLRYTLVSLEDGRIGSFAAFVGQDSASRSSELASELRAKSGSALSRVLSNAPQMMDGLVLGTYSR